MPPLGFHLVFRARDSRVLAPDVAAQRMLAVTMHRIGERFGLYAFRASGDHLHTGNRCDREQAAAFAQALGSALTQSLALPVGFAATYFEPMLHQRHVEETFTYIHRNTEKHGVGNDPTHEASSIQALLGLRTAPAGFIPRVRAVVPKVRRAPLLKLLGVEALEPCVRIELLADAAAGAVGLTTLDLSDLAVRARGAAVRVAASSAPLDLIAAALGFAERSARRARSAPPEPALEQMIALRMGHRAALGDRARLDLPL